MAAECVEGAVLHRALAGAAAAEADEQRMRAMRTVVVDKRKNP
jgi:hypothetical protein